jgi:MoaA/NifB/PqqE/SkfB family radical SAM enzyme
MDIARLLASEPELAAVARRLRAEPDLDFPLLSAKLKLTWRCNLRCGLCRLWRRPKIYDHSFTIPYETAAAILAQLHRRGLRKVHFSGGEVLLLDYFPAIVRLARELGLQVNLTTNGTLLTKDVARMLVDERVHSVTVSIDSPSARQHDAMRGRAGAWKDAWRGVEELVERKAKKGRGPTVAVNTIMTRKNIGRLDALYELLIARGVESWRLLPVDAESKKVRPTETQWRELAEQWSRWRHLMARLPLDWSSPKSAHKAARGEYAAMFYRNRVCFAPWFGLFVDADGETFPCCMGKANMQSYGNALVTPVSDILASTARRAVCCTMAAGQLFPVCATCDDYLEENQAFEQLYRKEDG